MLAPPPPRNPSPLARKLIYSYAGKQFVMLLVGLIFTAVGLPLSLVFCRDMPGELSLTLSHQNAVGQVTSAELQRNVTINDEHPTLITFTYPADGRVYSGESSTLSPGGLSAGSTVDIEYSASNPEWARIAGGTYGTFPLWIAFVLIFPLLGLAMAGAAVRSNRREIRAFRDGTEAEGRITNVGLDRTVTVNNQHPMKVEWSFEVLGAVYTGSLSNMDPEPLRRFRMGDAVTVLYVPDDPKANTVYID